MGAYPVKPYMVQALLNTGITTFVCLMQENEFDTRSEHYFEQAKKMLAENSEQFPQTAQQLRLLSLPIPDRTVVDDGAMLKLVEDVIGRLRRGEIVYVHCYGGHGRSGTLTAILIGRAYGVDGEKALELCQKFHDCRPDVDGIKASSVPSPQTHEQRAQVLRLLAAK